LNSGKIHNQLFSLNLEEFLLQYSEQNPVQFVLKNQARFGSDIAILAEQLKIYPKARHKVPFFCQNFCLFTSKSYEQASGEASAIYKSSLFAGNTILDLSAGLGVDDWAFSKTFNEVISLDPDIELNKIVRHNFERLGVTNVYRLDSTAEEFLEACFEKFDLIYIDADRRPNAQGRKFSIEDSRPDILGLKDKLFELSDNILLKFSPALDVQYITKTLPFVKKLIVLSVDGEVKELLCILKNGFNSPIQIEAVILKSQHEAFVFGKSDNSEALRKFSSQGTFLFEPDAAIIKSNLSSQLAAHISFSQLAANSHYLLGDVPTDERVGRLFQVKAILKYNKNQISKYLKSNKIAKCNVAARNFIYNVDEIRKIFKLKDGGDDYLFFSTDTLNNKLLFHCQKP